MSKHWLKIQNLLLVSTFGRDPSTSLRTTSFIRLLRFTRNDKGEYSLKISLSLSLLLSLSVISLSVVIVIVIVIVIVNLLASFLEKLYYIKITNLKINKKHQKYGSKNRY